MSDFSYLPDIHTSLLQWWQEHGRVLPWRQKRQSIFTNAKSNELQVREGIFREYMTSELDRDPYLVVVSELMLQQTQVDRVLPKYFAWVEKWPTIQDLANAQLSEVIIFWQGLGYNRRARFLWLLATEIVEEHNGEWPRTEEELMKLPGIGRYTARAVLSFAFGQHVAVVDTNVKRVIRRVAEGKEASAEPVLSEKKWFELADSILPDGLADPWNQLIMDFGALICTAKAPKCEVCPIQQYCSAQQTAVQLGYPTYREYLMTKPQAKKSSKVKTRFEDTDRYFRGRMIDLLRQNSYPAPQLFQKMSDIFNFTDRPRFDRLLTDLIKEGLISDKRGRLQLG